MYIDKSLNQFEFEQVLVLAAVGVSCSPQNSSKQPLNLESNVIPLCLIAD